MNTYRIKDGERLIMGDETKEGGDLIQLPDDLAEMHRSRLELVSEAEKVNDEQA